MPQIVNFRSLLDSADRGSQFWSRTPSIETQPFAVETGFHIYGELNLTLKLTAASDTDDASKLLRVLQEYVTIAETCAAIVDAELLEVQGERIHLLLPAPHVTKESVSKLLRFCIAFTDTVYARIQKLAGDDFRGFKMATDHGRAVLVLSGTKANASVVSLGKCANAPAKQMRSADAATLRLRTDHYKQVKETDEWREWINVSVKTKNGTEMAVASEDLARSFSIASEAEISAWTGSFAVKYGDHQFFQNALKSPISEAIKAQGFGFRADLDGFSKQVAEAKTDAQTIELVARFSRILAYPDTFAIKLGKPIIRLPWAGDCANIIVLPDGDPYDEAREFLPVRAASEWHSQMSGYDQNRTTWTTHVKGAKWSVGVAGGDEAECSNGYVLVAPLKGKRRDFLVAAGWGIGRSLDAQEADGVLGGDTVLHKIDHNALASTHKTNFSKLDGSAIYFVAKDLTNDKVRSSGASILAPKTSVVVPGVANIAVSSPKPWVEYE